jgi:glutathione S-transferase
MKLYYFPAACSLAPHIALREAGLPFTLVKYDTKTGALDEGGRLEDVNEKGLVPVLELDDGQRLTEVSAVLQYIADQKPESGLAPPAGTMPRYRLMEWLNFIATEVHKGYWPIFHDGADVEKQSGHTRIGRSYDFVQNRLGDREFLLGDKFTVADAYLLVTLNWTKAAGVDIERWPKLKAYRLRMRERPAVIAALDAEGLLKKR